MKKIYLKPTMELTECVMLRAAVCSGGDALNQDPNAPAPPAPRRRDPAF